MGKFKTFEIVLNSPHSVYFAGDILQGHVNIELNEAMKLKGIRVIFRGKAFVHWTDQNMRGPGESRYREIRHHSATEEYFDVSNTLLSKDPATKSETRVIPAGQYTYPFQFQLPSNIPSSFEGQYGHIRYYIKVMIEKPWRCDYTCQKVYTVICPLDLNRDPAAATPIRSQKQKKLCCLCCRTGPVSATLSLNQRGFVSGETIHVDAEITNLTRRKMGATSIELKMTTTFFTKTKTRSVTQQIMKRKRGRVATGESENWNSEPIVIPPLAPSLLIGCNIIDVRYILELRVEPVGPAFDLSIPIEIFIGTVPLHSTIQRHLAISQGRQSYHHSHGAGAEQLYHPNTYLPPPGFAKYPFYTSRVTEEDDEDRDKGDNYYTPAYVYYLWNSDQNNSNHPP
ncbi:arrestin domain-containing protein 3 [Patella vulgata]|uniref:arrestin domain-containing protein 3 n=1 Tax=Patella vulgata TaxID=6465 RepID=UPI0021808A67|nr:arrestin domain-containing protein 3 [Patella vulgata]XP_050401777.1 arrestin domain-containing protein 3 [Patella vulgata]XP_050401778.1 arrestin domain-containing protein 3 [Patella vulgata]